MNQSQFPNVAGMEKYWVWLRFRLREPRRLSASSFLLSLPYERHFMRRSVYELSISGRVSGLPGVGEVCRHQAVRSSAFD